MSINNVYTFETLQNSNEVTCYWSYTRLMQCILPVSIYHSSVHPDAILPVASRPWKGIQRIYNIYVGHLYLFATKIRTRNCVNA